MNWTKLQTHDLAPDKAFEMLCNQLFENLCEEQYSDDLLTFSFVNGSGGDGGVESYAVLKDDSVIGLQAKWFPSSMTSSQINQIKGSIETALKVRPNIKKYIVCVPRDLASKTAKGDNCEEDRWNNLLENIKKSYSDLSIELWNDTVITSELQKTNNAGVCRFWFEKSEISRETISFALEKAKNSWLKTKYEPDLNIDGDISRILNMYLGSIDTNKESVKKYEKILKLCDDFNSAAHELLKICDGKSDELSNIIKDTNESLSKTAEETKKILKWLYNTNYSVNQINLSVFNFYFDDIIKRIHNNDDLHDIYFHKRGVIKVLEKLSEFEISEMLSNMNIINSNKNIMFIGNPGTGKTHGVSSFANSLFTKNLHLPVMIQAKYIADDKSWREIIQSSIGLSNNWSEDEIWQGLTSLVNRYKLLEENLDDEINIVPKFLIIIDGLDEHSTKEKWIERINEASVITQKYPHIRFCFTARPSIFSISHDDINVVRLKNDGDTSVDELFDKYLEAYKISAENKGWLRQAISTPLALKLFCELNRNKTVNYTTHSEVAISTLWRKKIETLEDEYCLKENISTQNQYIFSTIIGLSELFIVNHALERSVVVTGISEKLCVSKSDSEKIINFLDSYGIITCYCERGIGISPDKYYYYSGFQGYFDYAIAESILSKYSPNEINFSNYKGINNDYIYVLAVISIQKYGYLITQNQTIDEILDEYSIQELQFYALQHTDFKTALSFVKRTKEIMSENASALILIVNKLILPFSRYDGHPLGVSLLDEYLSEFELPAQRDIFWSVCGYLKDAYDTKWYQNEVINLQDEKYKLSSEDSYSGCPTIYAWALSTNNNSMRKLYRNRLMEWSLLSPDEFYELFLKFAFVNDPQIRSDMFSILMCMLFECSDIHLIKKASKWLCTNILAQDKIDDNRDLAVRYYSIAIVRKAVSINAISEEEASIFLPPYKANNYKIKLNKDALSGTRMGGYKAISYDLARYVLIDHIESAFCDYCNRNDKFILDLLKNIEKEYPEYKGITFEQFIISAAYSYINQMGWNLKEFYDYSKNDDGKVLKSVDFSILGTYYQSDHGIQSPVMTICEKYIWQFRKYISGFLCDRIQFEKDNLKLLDYGLIDDFLIPSQEINQINPDDIPEEHPWYIPEKDKVLSKEDFCNCKEDLIRIIKQMPSIEWSKWLIVDNKEHNYKLNSDKLLALNMYSCFYDVNGIETNLFANSVIINKNDISTFLAAFSSLGEGESTIFNPTDWYGGIESFCYITPKEISWFPWKKRYESRNAEYFPSIKLSSSVDKCTYNYSDLGDVYYNMPSAVVRELLNICNTDGNVYWDIDKNLKVEYCITGEKWGEYQEYLFVDYDELINTLYSCNQTLVWIIRERRQESGKSHEKYGEFYGETEKVSLGYFENGLFKTIEIKNIFQSSEPNLQM